MESKDVIQLSGTYAISSSSLNWNHVLLFDDAKLKDWVKSNGKRVKCSMENILPFSTPLLDDGEGGYFITLKKALRDQLNVSEGDEVVVSFLKDESRYGVEVSEAFLEVLSHDVQGARYFHLLTPGKQRTLIHWVDQVRAEQIRIRRCLVLMRHLNDAQGKLDFKELNAMMKKENQKYKKG